MPQWAQVYFWGDPIGLSGDVSTAGRLCGPAGYDICRREPDPDESHTRKSNIFKNKYENQILLAFNRWKFRFPYTQYNFFHIICSLPQSLALIYLDFNEDDYDINTLNFSLRSHDCGA